MFYLHQHHKSDVGVGGNMHVLPTPTSYIYVGVGGNMHVLPTPTS